MFISRRERERGGVWPREPPLGLAVVSSDHDWGEIKGGENRETERERESVCVLCFCIWLTKKKLRKFENWEIKFSI